MRNTTYPRPPARIQCPPIHLEVRRVPRTSRNRFSCRGGGGIRPAAKKQENVGLHTETRHMRNDEYRYSRRPGIIGLNSDCHLFDDYEYRNPNRNCGCIRSLLVSIYIGINGMCSRIMPYKAWFSVMRSNSQTSKSQLLIVVLARKECTTHVSIFGKYIKRRYSCDGKTLLGRGTFLRQFASSPHMCTSSQCIPLLVDP